MIARYQPGAEAEIIASELDELMGVSILPNGNIVVAEAGAGSVLEIDGDNTISHLVQSLQRPTGCMLVTMAQSLSLMPPMVGLSGSRMV
ncbi:MAG: hypothetical protein R3E73_05095 [Porticoccaceae bacterium]